MVSVDLLVIGWGKAGKSLAAKASATGRTVALVERSPQMYGGTCINVACVPTKDLLTSAELRRPGDDPADWFRDSVAGRDRLIGTLNGANHAMLDGKPGVTLVDGVARFTGPKTVTARTVDGDVSITAETIVIGTGTVPTPLTVPGGSGPRVYDSTTIQHVDPFPLRLVIVGGGFVGLEFANMFAHFGSRVTVLDTSEVFLPRLDRDVADAVHGTLREHGIDIVLNASVAEIVDGEQEAVVRSDRGDVRADAVLAAVGRTPVTSDLGLDVAGVAMDERGYIVVDDRLQTSVPGVYAVGDVNGGPQFTYVSFDDHRIVWDAIAGDGRRRRSDRVAVPITTFITPPLSQVGMSESDARTSGRPVLVASKPVASIAAMPRPKIVGETHGLIKVLADAATRRILGATVFSTDSQEVINLVALAMRLDATVDDLRDGIWTHPSSTEGLNEVLADLAPLT
ncbi:MAG TPA: FAD-dependent oxidoreductase [Propionibacteriaceae bacterium]|nr:FAD-dependent oxidoreductase [Propionibacteriaceae bacterium]